jgi:SpoVK/Ycf46/Vps4 family AAA+-type ATPase
MVRRRHSCERGCDDLSCVAEAICKLADAFNGADLRNVCTEAGMFAIRASRDYVTNDDFMRAVRKVGESKKLESTLGMRRPGVGGGACDDDNALHCRL